MQPSRIDVLTAARLPELWRRVCTYAGIPVAPGGPRITDRFVIGCGRESPQLLAKLLEEVFAEGEVDVTLAVGDTAPDYQALPPGQILVRPGYESPCPPALRRALHAATDLGDVLIFAVEQRDERGRLCGMTWAALPDELPLPEVPLTAAVTRQILPAP